MEHSKAFAMGVAFRLGAEFGRCEMAQDAKVSEKVKRWITVNGTHIPIGKSGQPMNAAGKRAFAVTAPTRHEKQYRRTENGTIAKQDAKNRQVEAGAASKNDGAFKHPMMQPLQKQYDAVAKQAGHIYNVIEGIAHSLGATLVGKEYAVKSASSTERKVLGKAAEIAEQRNRKQVAPEDVRQAFSQMTDVTRFTVMGRHDSLPILSKKVAQGLKEKGYTVVERDNKYLKRDAEYKGIHLLAQDPKTSTVFEVQVHSPRSMGVKNTNHKLYEEQRLSTTTVARKAELGAQMKKNVGEMPGPKGIGRLRWEKGKTK